MGIPTSQKYFLHGFYVVNVIYFLLGCGFMTMGIRLYLDQHTLAALAPSSYSAMSTAGLCICGGCMIMVVSLIGSGAASISSKWLMTVYIGFVCLLFLVLFLSGIIGFLHDGLARERVKHSLYSTINRTFVTDFGPESSFRLTWDYMQETFHCCGVESYEDWFYAAQWPKNKFAPDSCCDQKHFAENGSNEHCGKTGKEELLYQHGCYEPFADWILHHLSIIKMFAFVFSFIEIALVIMAIQLIRSFGKARLEASYRYSTDRHGNDKLLTDN